MGKDASSYEEFLEVFVISTNFRFDLEAPIVSIFFREYVLYNQKNVMSHL